jgi:hypothetical protein
MRDAISQECNDILKYGIFDFSHVSSQSDLASQFLSWMRASNMQTASDMQDNSFGIGVPEAMVDFGNKSGNSQSWKNDYANSLNQSSSQKSLFDQQFSTANPNLIAAWQSCIVNRTGVIAYARRIADSTTIILTIRVKRKSDMDKLDSLKILDIQCSNFLTPITIYKNQYLSETGEKAFAFTIREPQFSSRACYFLITTSLSGYDSQFELAPIINKPTSPKQPDVYKPTVPCETLNHNNLQPWLDLCLNSEDGNACRELASCFSQKAGEAQDPSTKNNLSFVANIFSKAAEDCDNYHKGNFGAFQTGDNMKMMINQNLYQAQAVLNSMGY